MSQAITALLNKTKIDPSWFFSDKTRKDTAYITHDYHRYHAKFIHQIVSRLAEKYTREGDFIADPFGGCGTTLVESKWLQKIISRQEILRRNHQNQSKHF